jgi:glucokinase
VVVAVSSAGRFPELLAAVDTAMAGGAQVIAITASQSPLARKATVCIPVDHDEESPNFIAMISRILHLLVIDILAVGVALQRADLAQLQEWADLAEEEQRGGEGGHRISHIG